MRAHAIRVHQTGGPEALRWEEVEVGDPGPGQARVRQQAIGVNYIDTYHRSGLYPLPSLPHGIGQEAAGLVEAVAPDVADLRVGDRVAYASGLPPGAYAEARIVPADRLVKLPDAVAIPVAAGMMLKGMTVEYLIRRTFPVRPGMTVLWHAAAGGVGLIACQWLRHLGAIVIGTVGSEEKAALATAHGCHHTILYQREDFVARVRQLTGGHGVPVVFDSVGAATFARSLQCLEPRGMLVNFGNASGAAPPFDPIVLMRGGSLYLTRPNLADYTRTRDDLTASAAALFQVVETGAVRIELKQSFPLRDAIAAHRALESRDTVGSTILLP